LIMAIRWTTNRPAPAKTVVDQNRPWIAKQREAGETWRNIAEKLGITRQSLQMWFGVDQFDFERKRARARASEERKRRELGVEPGRPREYRKLHEAVTKIEIAGEREPPDTRDLTGRILGDPIPGRRWIDRMKQQEQRT